MNDGSPMVRYLAGIHLAACLVVAATGANAMTFDRSSLCESLQRQTTQDQWAVFEYTVQPGISSRPSIELEFASDPTYAQHLRHCFERQQAHLPQDGTGQHVLFRFKPSSRLIEAQDERRMQFRAPSWLQRKLASDNLRGNLAVRLEMDANDVIVRKEVLFSSDYALGQWVLDSLDEAISIRGQGPSSTYVDVLYLRFQSTGLTFFEQLHYRDPSAP